MASKKSAQSAGLQHGWRSGLEESVCQQLVAAKVEYKYEPFKIAYTPLRKVRYYTPDIVLIHNGIVVETKGRFVTADRQKHLAIQEQYPDLDLRFVFSNPNSKIGKGSKTSYGDWCSHKGFQYAKVSIPYAWLTEKPNVASLAVIKQLMESK